MKTTLIKIFLFATMLLVGPTANASITDNGVPTADPLTLAGGNTAGSVIANASSEVNLSGGSANNITMDDSSVFNATSGTVVFQTTLNDTSQGDITGGAFKFVAANDSAVLTIGGTVTISNDLGAQGSSTVNVTGGTLGPFTFANNTATLNLLGGNMGQLFYNNSSTGTISGGAVWDTLDVGNDSVVQMLGSGFTLDGSPVSGNLVANTFGNLMGTLQNGDSLDVDLSVFGNGVLTLVPEPATSSMALLIGLFCFCTRRRTSYLQRVLTESDISV